MATTTLNMDCVEFEIYSDLEWANDDGTLVVRSPRANFVILRCSVQSVFHDGVEDTGAAERVIQNVAEESGIAFERIGECVVYRTSQPSNEDPKSVVHFWHFGLGGHLGVVSLFVDFRFSGDERTKHVMDCAELLVRSFRRTDNL